MAEKIPTLPSEPSSAKKSSEAKNRKGSEKLSSYSISPAGEIVQSEKAKEGADVIATRWLTEATHEIESSGLEDELKEKLKTECEKAREIIGESREYYKKHSSGDAYPNAEFDLLIKEKMVGILREYVTNIVKSKSETEAASLVEEMEQEIDKALLFKGLIMAAKETWPYYPVHDAQIGDYWYYSAKDIAKKKNLAEKMRAVYRDNYRGYPPEFVDKLIESFDKTLEDDHSYFHLWENEEDVVAFCRIQARTDESGRKYNYFGSFNTGRL